MAGVLLGFWGLWKILLFFHILIVDVLSKCFSFVLLFGLWCISCLGLGGGYVFGGVTIVRWLVLCVCVVCVCVECVLVWCGCLVFSFCGQHGFDLILFVG